VASIIDPVIDPAIMPDPIPTLEQGHLLPDLQYQRSRPILCFQLLFIFGLIFLKYGTYFTQTKLKGFQVKLFGSLLLCQCLLMHQKTTYSLIWQEFEMKSLIDALIVAVLFVISFFNLTRLNHLIPNSWRGQYQLMAQRVMDRNERELHLTSANTDLVYENQLSSADDSGIEGVVSFQDPPNTMSMIFGLMDFLVQCYIACLFTLNILTKEGYISTLAPDAPLYLSIRRFGLTKNISLIAFFCISHLNQSRYVGISKWDGVQYFCIRFLTLMLPFLIVAKSDYTGTIRYHFEQLLAGIAWLAYFALVDWHNSRKNQLALYFDEMFTDSLNNEIGDGEHSVAERSQYRMVLIMFRPDGRGGIQGIVLDSFYVDADGNVANEFYVVSDATEGEIRKIEDGSIRPLQDAVQVQKAFYQYFLMDK